MPSSPKRLLPKSVLEYVLLAFLILLIFGIVMPPCGHGIHEKAKIKISLVQEKQLALAMKSYREKFGTYPAGDPAAVLRALQGSNPEKIVFLSLSGNSLDSTGRLLDPWWTPYEIMVTGTNTVFIRSAGRNKRFGDADDVATVP
jgi:hypothetical protein